MNSFAVQAGKEELRKKAMSAEHKWAVDSLDVVDKLNPKFKRIADQPIFSSPYRRELPWQFRILYRALALLPKVQTTLRLLHYQF